jgi:hypothetical protein
MQLGFLSYFHGRNLHDNTYRMYVFDWEREIGKLLDSLPETVESRLERSKSISS